MQRARLHIVSGPSSCGKSQYIRSLAGTYDEVLFPSALEKTTLTPGRRYALHYNLLRPVERLTGLHESASLEKRARALGLGVRMRVQNPFSTDRALRALSPLRAAGAELCATVLVTPRAELARRMLARDARETLVEDGLAYPKEKWLELLSEVDLLALYRDWLEFLRTHGVTYQLIDAGEPSYRRLVSLGELEVCLAVRP
ncbi:MAG: hypothetical protein K8S98_17340 [Planctomycetes bacterium]|nr:hypothetical protein [Planctomycetota bacterium]